MEAWSEFLEEPRLLDPKFATRQGRMENWEELHSLVAPTLARWNNLDLMQETMARGLVIGLVQSPQQVVGSPHLAERGYFVEIDHPEAGNPGQIQRRCLPALYPKRWQKEDGQTYRVR